MFLQRSFNVLRCMGETILPAKWSLARETRESREDARGILQIIPLERCPWLVGVRDCVLARTCTLGYRTKRGRPARSGSPVGSCTYIAQSRNARATGFDRTTCCIYRRRARCCIRTGHRPRITRTQFAHIKPITCFGRMIREFCDCISDALFNFQLISELHVMKFKITIMR